MNKQVPAKTPAKCDGLERAAALLGQPKAMLKELKSAGCPGFHAGSRVDIEEVRPIVEIMARMQRPLSERERVRLAREELALRDAQRQSGIMDKMYFDKRDLAQRLQMLGAKLNQYLGRARLRFHGEAQTAFDETHLHLLALLREAFGGFSDMDVTIEARTCGQTKKASPLPAERCCEAR